MYIDIESKTIKKINSNIVIVTYCLKPFISLTFFALNGKILMVVSQPDIDI